MATAQGGVGNLEAHAGSVSGLSDQAAQVQAAADAVSAQSAENAAASDAVQQLKSGLAEVQEGLDDINAAGDSDPYATLKQQIKGLTENLDKVDDGYSDTLIKGAAGITDKKAADAVVSGAEEVKTGVTALTKKVGSLLSEEKLEKLTKGAATLTEASEQLNAGYKKASKSSDKLVKGATKLQSYNKDLTGGADKLTKSGKTLKKGANDLDKASKQVSAGTSKVGSATSQLTSGASTLSANSSTLRSGAGQLASGTQQLVSGAGTLSSGSKQVKDGISDLADGAKKLADGTKEFDEDGIQKIKEVVDDDLQDVLDRLDALCSDKNTYTSFSGKTDDMDGNVKFVIETAAIESDDDK